MIDFPGCKINLGLSVLRKRPDGFHEVETLMYPVPMNDALEIIPARDGQFSFNISGFDISGDRKANLVVRAFELIKSEFDLPAIKVHLHKAIPFGAGLGGGSADAAATIKLCNQLFNLNLSVEEMEDYARPLASDYAFFIHNHPAPPTAKGDQVHAENLSLKNSFLLIVKPPVHINTTEAYSWITPTEKEANLQKIVQMPLKKWRGLLLNDFENAVFEKFPEIRGIRDELYSVGALYASLSGSGSAVFGLFDKEPATKDRFENYFTWQGKL